MTTSSGQNNRTAVLNRAQLLKVHPNQICTVCLNLIEMQIFKNTGICCEQHRKDRDNDHLPAQTAF